MAEGTKCNLVEIIVRQSLDQRHIDSFHSLRDLLIHQVKVVFYFIN